MRDEQCAICGKDAVYLFCRECGSTDLAERIRDLMYRREQRRSRALVALAIVAGVALLALLGRCSPRRSPSAAWDYEPDSYRVGPEETHHRPRWTTRRR